MRLFTYKFLTQIIIIFGRLRDLLKLQLTVRKDRTFRDPPHVFSVICCDCGLTHMYSFREGVRFQQPVRPENYDYSLRFFEDEPSEYKPESEWV